MPSVNKISRDFVKRLENVRYVNNEINDLRLEVGKWSLENAGMLVFDKRLGCLTSGTSEEELGRQMVEANATIFKVRAKIIKAKIMNKSMLYIFCLLSALWNFEVINAILQVYFNTKVESADRSRGFLLFPRYQDCRRNRPEAQIGC